LESAVLIKTLRGGNGQAWLHGCGSPSPARIPRASSSCSSRNAQTHVTRDLWRCSRLARSAADSGGSGRPQREMTALAACAAR
jgi:hypothetical protein